MIVHVGVTTVTTVTVFSRVPPLRVAQIVRKVSGIFLRNSARGDASKSGYSGYGGYGYLREGAA